MQFDNSLPIYQQVVTTIKKEIAAGRIKPGDKLPSCRDLAVQYRINPNTAARVYQVLETEKVTETRRGTGTYVRSDPCLLTDMRKEMADGYTQMYIRDMADLGYHRDEILHCLESWSSPEDWIVPEEKQTNLSEKE